MNYLSAKEVARRWGISERMVRYYCDSDRIKDAYQEDGVWYISEKSKKPERKQKELPQLPKFLRSLLRQRDSGRYKGLYDYIQINMAYSNSRLASNRLTRTQVEVLYQKDRIFTVNEPIKIRDILEIRNQFECVDLVLSEAMTPLSLTLVEKIHTIMLNGTCGHKRKAISANGYRKDAVSAKYGTTTPPDKIREELKNLFKEYESQKEIGFHEILDFHVSFEEIRPFEDYNGRIGRLLMLKECLRHEVIPFIIDDKRRNGYLEGIRQWHKDRSILMDVCMEAQMRFEDQIELQKLLKCHAMNYSPKANDK